MEQHVFCILIYIEGTTEKVLQFIMQLKSIYYKNLGFIEQKNYFWTLQRGSDQKKSTNWHYICHDNFFLMTFLELPSIIGLC